MAGNLVALSVLCLMIVWCQSAPLKEEETSIESREETESTTLLLQTNREANNVMGAEELDIILLPEQKALLTSPGAKSRRKRKIVEKKDKRWPIPIFYKFDASCKDRHRSWIRGALSHWQEQTCIRFFEVNDKANLNTHHIIFTSLGNRCGSFVGMVNLTENNPQIINLPDLCLEKFGTAVHEIGHALGLWHEHQRPDRDGHVTIVNDNLVNWAHGNFDPAHDEVVDQHGLPYDYNSVMHYAATAGSINGSPTLRTRDGLYQKNIGQRVELSFLDAKVVNTAYCKSVCRVPLPYPCLHGGYQDPNNCSKCRCPDGMAGRFCDQVAPSSNEMCGGTIQLGSDTTVTLTSPGYTEGRPYENKLTCNWLVKAPQDHTIELMFLGDFSVYCRQEVCFHWVEVKHRSNFQYPGPRFCCSSRPQRVLESEGEQVLVTFRANWTVPDLEDRRGFSLALHAKPNSLGHRQSDGDWQLNTRNSRDINPVVSSQRNPTTTQTTTIPTTTTAPTTTTTTTPRPTTTTPTPTTTTQATTTTTKTTTTTESLPTTAPAFSWSAWSECTGSVCACGSCSTQTRRRLCGGATCPPLQAREQHRRCSRQCTERDAVVNFVPFRVTHCPRCCPGFRSQSGRCVSE